MAISYKCLFYKKYLKTWNAMLRIGIFHVILVGIAYNLILPFKKQEGDFFTYWLDEIHSWTTHHAVIVVVLCLTYQCCDKYK